jgi:hypothetical protein
MKLSRRGGQFHVKELNNEHVDCFATTHMSQSMVANLLESSELDIGSLDEIVGKVKEKWGYNLPRDTQVAYRGRDTAKRRRLEPSSGPVEGDELTVGDDARYENRVDQDASAAFVAYGDQGNSFAVDASNDAELEGMTIVIANSEAATKPRKRREKKIALSAVDPQLEVVDIQRDRFAGAMAWPPARYMIASDEILYERALTADDAGV